MPGRAGRPKGMTDAERFWEKVDRRADDKCWLWTGGRVGPGDSPFGGYGRFAIGTTRGNVVLVLPHRYAWEQRFGPIPAGLLVLHACDTPACVNPEHLMLGTHRANSIDARQKGRLQGMPHAPIRSASGRPGRPA